MPGNNFVQETKAALIPIPEDTTIEVKPKDLMLPTRKFNVIIARRYIQITGAARGEGANKIGGSITDQNIGVSLNDIDHIQIAHIDPYRNHHSLFEQEIVAIEITMFTIEFLCNGPVLPVGIVLL